MLVLVNFATSSFRRAQKLNSWTGKHIAGFDKTIEWIVDKDGKYIDEAFYYEHEKIFLSKKGAHLWKPYCVLKSLEELQEGDILFYCDSGSFFTKNIKDYLSRNVNDIWVSDIPFLEKQWSNGKAFDVIGCSMDEEGEKNQIQSGFIGIRKNSKTIEFVREWLRYCCAEDVMISSEDGNDESFIENRDDQTALSLLCKREGIMPYPDPTQYGKVPEQYMRDPRFLFAIPKQNYERNLFIILHRTRNISFMICLKQLFISIMPRMISIKIMNMIRR